ncbi:hypothetical protein M8997_013825 [Phyllobacterium sp. 21LDTY02-6]|uniref:hypothetical protein n=1 Tax=Phyllobacterium sp. 21LDTY02-6 TaxID=2944903 RepID=UPI00201FD92A|nr:hypothetical protein [Phyllobacterium sp. 21LDTY02-6]MCO4318269.1 hypothetical protein [Phyllobacterium sp. 21LDTY02-6]
MKSAKNLEKLLELRAHRTRIAEETSARQRNIRDAAAHALDRAGDEILQNEARRVARESDVHREMSQRPVASHELQSYQEALAAYDFEATRLVETQKEVAARLEQETERSNHLIAEHKAKLRSHDKLELLLKRQAASSAKHRIALEETEDEDQRGMRKPK